MKKKLLIVALLGFFALAFFALRRPSQAPFPSSAGTADLGKIFPAQARDVFDGGALTIYALKADDDGAYNGENASHGFKVLGSAQLSAVKAKELRAAFYENAAKPAMPMMCFFPHHGIRAEKDDQQVDLAICFKCGHVYSYWNGKEYRNMFSAEGREIFNAIYRRADVTIDDKWP